MLSGPKLAAAAIASPAIAAAFAALLSGAATPARADDGGCAEAAEIAVLPSPLAPWKGAPLRVVFAAERPLQGALSLTAPDGSLAASSDERHDGPPYFWFAEVAAPPAGTWHATLTTPGCNPVTRDIVVRAEPAPPPAVMASGAVWQVRNAWSRSFENLYSAWIEKLFDAPLDAEPSWTALHEVLRDRSRNFLFNYLGLSEDEAAIPLRPDCADLVYFLRAYFALKMGLPFGYSNCSRGGGGKPPKCYTWLTNLNTPTAATAAAASAGGQLLADNTQAVADQNSPPVRRGLAATFGDFLHKVGDAVQSGAVRTLANDDNTDFYTVPLTEQTLRPGTVYADPYGHVLVLVRRVPQSGGGAGVFLAVDGEPDGTVARKRFWRGTFLFAHEPGLEGPGFKRFRPVMRDQAGALRRLTNAEISRNGDYGDFSLEQSQLSVDDFYDRMDEVMSPAPLDPILAMKGAIDSLEEQVKTRVGSVENGRKFQSSGKGDASMPDGPSIFATTGAWEDFATPARDFRLLIAIDVVRGYPDRVARLPQRYAIAIGQAVPDVQAQMRRVLAEELAARKFTYTRSDGSSWTLSLQDVVDRAGDLEMGYNLNDCVELRWGAPANSDEASTCKRHAPQAQRAKMTDYRPWFRDRNWPHV